MDKIKVLDHLINIAYPLNYDKNKKYKLLVLNDGDMLEKLNIEFDGLIFGVIPNNRLKEYTPYYAKALRENVEDFGGESDLYNEYINNSLLPYILDNYNIDMNYLIYGGYSLGGLCAVDSLFKYNRFNHIISICGSFWFPDYTNNIKSRKIVNKANIYLLNGNKEGLNHNNILAKAKEYAEEVHKYLKPTVSIFDDYAHHDKTNERINLILSKIEM
ncbi:MAG: hypothetical protein K6A63_03125 [Acholeplasmatales bacterium]|nr:hypothetical protein [Acholeplasmatales bacterium]